MSKGVKTIVQVASLAAGAYGAYSLISGAASAFAPPSVGAVVPEAAATTGLTATAPSAGGLAATTQGGVSAGISAAGKGLLSAKGLQTASIGMQGLSMGMQKVASMEEADARQEQEKLQNRVLERQQQKAIVQQVRAERIQREGAIARSANIGGGTAPQATIAGLSSLQGGLGALGMQSAENQQEIRFGASSARAIGSTMGRQATAQSSQQGWSNMQKLGQDLWTKAPGISAYANQNIFA
jgi:hypothetical protein